MKEKYLSNVMSQGIGRFVSMSVSFSAFVIFARVYGPEILGQFAYVLNFIAIAGVIVEFGTTSVMAKQLAQLDSDEARLYWGNFLFLRAGIYLLFLVPVIAAAFAVRPDIGALLACCSVMLPFFCFRFFEPVFQIYERPWYSALTNLFYSIVWFFVILLLVKFCLVIDGIVAGYIFSNILFTLFSFFLAGKLLKPVFRLDTGHIRKILILSLPIWISSVFSMFNIRVGIFMLSSMKSDIAVGFYSVPMRFFEMAITVGVVSMYPLVPIFSRLAADNPAELKRIFSQILEFMAVILLPLALVAPLFTSPVLGFFFSAEFVETSSTLNVFVWVGVLLFFNLLSSVLNLSLGVVRHGYWNTALALLITICLNYYLIPVYGYYACAVTTLISESVLFGISFYYNLKKIGNFINFPKWIYITGGNVIVYAGLQYDAPYMNNFLKVLVLAAVYAAYVYLTKLVDKAVVTSVYAQIKSSV